MATCRENIRKAEVKYGHMSDDELRSVIEEKYVGLPFTEEDVAARARELQKARHGETPPTFRRRLYPRPRESRWLNALNAILLKREMEQGRGGCIIPDYRWIDGLLVGVEGGPLVDKSQRQRRVVHEYLHDEVVSTGAEISTTCASRGLCVRHTVVGAHHGAFLPSNEDQVWDRIARFQLANGHPPG